LPGRLNIVGRYAIMRVTGMFYYIIIIIYYFSRSVYNTADALLFVGANPYREKKKETMWYYIILYYGE